MKPRRPYLLVFAAAGLLSMPAHAAEVGDGRAVAERVCKRCHVIGTDTLHGSIGSTPSFFLMKEKLDDYRQRVLSLNARPPHKGQKLDLSRAELLALLAYIATLERP